jgi:hypothetical protein
MRERKFKKKHYPTIFAHPITEEQRLQYKENLRVAVSSMIDEIVDYCKGRIPWREGRYFYNYFRIRSSQKKVWAVPWKLREVSAALNNAWWVEEEDIRQQICLFIFMFNPWLALNARTRRPYKKWFAKLKWKLLTLMARWIEGQKVFGRARFEFRFQDEYSTWLLNRSSPEEENILTIFSAPENSKQNQQTLFDRYLYHLWYTLGTDRDELADILVTNTRQVDRFKSKFYPTNMICKGKRRFYATEDSK